MPAEPTPRKLTGKTYPELRYEIQIKRGLTLGNLTEVLSLSSAAINNRLAGKKTFRLAECYKILDWLGLPDEDLLRLFPRL